MNHPRVSVLMSTYNGEKYIQEQIDSILKQRDVGVQLLIRDDGSSDNTPSICKAYKEQYPNISFYQGNNIGVGRSFMELLRNAPEADYYSFADQDDVWLEDKLSRAVNIITKAEEKAPILYTSNQILVDENLEKIGMRFLEEPRHDLIQEVSTNQLSGCTMVMNKELRNDLVAEENRPDDYFLDTRLHDTWIMIIASIFGLVFYDSDSYILYRQHENNVVGEKKLTPFQKLKDKYIRLTSEKYKGNRSRLAEALLDKFEIYMTDSQRQELNLVNNCKSLEGFYRLIGNGTVRSSFKESDLILLAKSLFQWI